MTSQRPELEVRRQMLSEMRDNFRAQGFQAEVNADAMAVQQVPADQKDAKEKVIADYEIKAENCYKSAEQLSAQLAKLPKAKKEAKG